MGKSLEKWAEEFHYYSGKASEATKSLAFGGIAVIWVFHEDSPSKPTIDPQFIFPLALFTLSLACDLLHYIVGAITWYWFFIYHERNTPKKKQDNISAPEWKRDLVTGFFYVKIAVLLLAYVVLIIQLFNRLF